MPCEEIDWLYYESVTLEIDEGFLKWAGETAALPHDQNVPIVVSEPKFIDFLDWVADQKKEDK